MRSFLYHIFVSLCVFTFAYFCLLSFQWCICLFTFLCAPTLSLTFPLAGQWGQQSRASRPAGRWCHPGDQWGEHKWDAEHWGTKQYQKLQDTASAAGCPVRSFLHFAHSINLLLSGSGGCTLGGRIIVLDSSKVCWPLWTSKISSITCYMHQKTRVSSESSLLWPYLYSILPCWEHPFRAKPSSCTLLCAP